MPTPKLTDRKPKDEAIAWWSRGGEHQCMFKQ